MYLIFEIIYRDLRKCYDHTMITSFFFFSLGVRQPEIKRFQEKINNSLHDRSVDRKKISICC
jgi:hypothetical protein